MPNTLIRMPAVQARTGLSKAGVYFLIKEGKFPQSIPLGQTRTVAWIEAEVDAWVEERITEARAHGAPLGATAPKECGKPTVTL